MSILKKESTDKREIIENMERIIEEIKDVKNNMNMVTDEYLIDSCIYTLKALERQYQYYLIMARKSGITGFEKIG